MAVPSYWDTDFAVRVSSGTIANLTALLAEVRAILTVTLPVASRWTESPTGTFTSPLDANNNAMRITIFDGGGGTIGVTGIQIVNNGTVTVNTGRCNIGGNSIITIFAGPKHFWMEFGNGGNFFGAVIMDPTPEQVSLYSVNSIFKSSVNQFGGNDQHADMWAANDPNNDGLATSKARCQGPWYPVNAGGTFQMITAGGSFVFFPAVGVLYPTNGSNANLVFLGTLVQFVWVDQSYNASVRVSVPIDVGVIGVFQVLGSLVTPSIAGNGPKLAVRVG